MSFIKITRPVESPVEGPDWRLIKRNWRQLSRQLCVLEPTVLSDTEFKLIAQWHQNPDRKIYDRLPLVVAQWRETAKAEIHQKAIAQHSAVMEKENDLTSVLQRWMKETKLLDAALFGSDENSLTCFSGQIGRFKEVEFDSEPLHFDALVYSRLYLSRLIDLPTLAIDRHKLRQLGPVRRIYAEWLIHRGKRNFAPTKFKDKLRRMKILMPLPLGAVCLLATHQACQPASHATLHCASDIAVRNNARVPTFSALYKAAFR